ncbi:hypothetical protein [Roseovarius Plymouth podovirus 1]|uniref:Uncharacterized protein n=2 Tax=Roseovarius Plymouth podovirus 1 TaxID=926474 RepID=K4Q4V6_9CAUD|nr:hypothetical protein HYO70_gp85 [Roseovarius Plymouth podovirus 1]CBW47084.1 hypothetical protein [Roseovarius sp. 217 phage 1]CBX88019.1 hypothetical protein [Roseovarius Plymouth podovirus 1]
MTDSPNVIYVNFQTKEASFVGHSSAPIIVGPILSLVDGVPHLTVDMTLDEIKALKEPQYQQLQLEYHPNG